MFKKLYEEIDLVLRGVYALTAELRGFKDLFTKVEGESRRRDEQLETWIELLADTKADDVAYEFSKLLDAHTKAGHKITNVALQQLVHQAVLNTKK